MIVSQLLKTVPALLFCMAASPDIHAQSAPWYQRYAPQYYYGSNPGYQSLPQYQYQYPWYRQSPGQQLPAQAPQQTPKPADQAQKPESRQNRKAEPSRDNIVWHSDFNSAWATACKQGRPLVALFVHHGCPECDRMDATLAQPAALATLDSAVKVRVEFTQNADLVHQFGLKFTPTFLVFSPASQGEVYREVGALSLDRLRQLQPSIDSLVTGPPATESETQATRSKEESRQISSDDSTTRSIASL